MPERTDAASLWKSILACLRRRMVLSAYQSDFGYSHATSLEHDILTVRLPNAYAKEWVENRLGTIVKQAQEEAGLEQLTIRFEVKQHDRPAGNDEQAPAIGQKAETTIVVRDRRTPHQFSIENLVLDEWLPIIGQIGFMLYAFYVRMADREEEKSFPSYSLIQRHLGIGAASISEHNQLLVWCGLLHIKRGTRHAANIYYILDPLPITVESLASLRQQTTQWWSKRAFGRTVLQRIDGWESLQAIWAERRSDKQNIRVLRAVHHDDDNDGRNPAREDVSALENELAQLGVRQDEIRRLLRSYPADRIRHAIEKTRARQAEAGSAALKNPAGYLCTLLDKKHV
jgi:hypothetical protein